MTLAELRADLVGNTSLHGAAFCEALTEHADQWLADLYRTQVGEVTGVALAAVGGYGRGELCPHSDLDVLLIHDRPEDEISPIASELSRVTPSAAERQKKARPKQSAAGMLWKLPRWRERRQMSQRAGL